MKVLLVAYDNDSYIHWFPQGLAYIAAALLKDGCDVSIYNQDKDHRPDEDLTRYLDANDFDFVGVGVIAGYYQYRKLLKISEAINRSRKRPFYIIGGHGPSPEPEFFMRKTGADAIVMGEGEETIVELVRSAGLRRPLEPIKGIAYRDGNRVMVNPRRQLIKDIDRIPFPAYHLFPVDHYRLLRGPHTRNNDFVMPVLSGRGCTFRCNFCYRMDEGFRPRSDESIIEEIELLKKDYGVTYIMFSDELLMSSPQRTRRLCENFIKAKLNVRWSCNGRLNFAEPGLLAVMKRAGCVFINYGIEAMDDVVLKNMNKVLTTDQIVKGIEATLEVGISPGFNIIFGNIGDNKSTLDKGVEFLLKYDDGAQMRTIRPVTPYPGSPLYYHALKEGLLKDVEEFYEKKHVNSDLVSVNFTDMSDKDFHLALMEANSKLLSNYFDKKQCEYVKQTEDLYMGGNAAFRGFRQT